VECHVWLDKRTDAAHRRNLAIRFLQLIGCEVDQVTDAESAIAKINTSPFDVVFMDIILPKMTGYVGRHNRDHRADMIGRSTGMMQRDYYEHQMLLCQSFP
jgi:PleD family two-component response regulator